MINPPAFTSRTAAVRLSGKTCPLNPETGSRTSSSESSRSRVRPACCSTISWVERRAADVNVRRIVILLAAGLACVAAPAAAAQALSTALMAADPKMNPKRFASDVADFAYEFHARVQAPDDFLSRKAGDCDDYAVAADVILRLREYHTRLVHVRMVGRVAHAVCYVEESRAYLDYNNRRYFFKLTGSKPRLREIAEKVAAGFEANWTSASEFTYNTVTEEKTIKATVVKTSPEAGDPDAPHE